LTPSCQLQTAGTECENGGVIINGNCRCSFNAIPRGGASKESDQSDLTPTDDMTKTPPSLLPPPPPLRASDSPTPTYLVSSYKTKGARPYMEDEFLVSNGGKFAAVFDGHGGSAVSRYLRQNLHANLQAALPAAAAAEAMENRSTDNMEGGSEEAKGAPTGNLSESSKSAIPTAPSVHASVEALRTAFEKVDAEVNRISHWSYQGSTAVAVMTHEGSVESDGFIQRTLIAANVGDSRAILCSRDGAIVKLTRDHKPNDSIERQRIEGCGGSVDWCGMRDEEGKRIEGTGVYRINGNLAVARAIGDRAEKPCVSSEVEILTYDISGDRTGDFILLASDGLWDVMENTDVADFVRSKLQEVVADSAWTSSGERIGADEQKQLRIRWKRIAEFLVSEALQRGSTDNVSVVIILIK